MKKRTVDRWSRKKNIKSLIMAYRYFRTCSRMMFFLVLMWCKSPDSHQGGDTDEAFYKAKDLTGEGTFTSGIEGPAVDRNGNLFAVNFREQGTVGIVDTYLMRAPPKYRR